MTGVQTCALPICFPVTIESIGYVSKGGIIVELFFLSNKTELDSYNAKKWLVAEAIANVIADHIKNGKIS